MHSPIAAARAKVGGAGRTAAETPGSARLLDEDELYLDKLLHAAGAGSPPAAPSDGPAHRAFSQYEHAPVDRHQSARRRLLDLDSKRRRPSAPRGDAV